MLIFVVVLINLGNGDHSIPEGEGHKGNNPSESNKSQHKATDWREFRAILYLNQQVIFLNCTALF